MFDSGCSNLGVPEIFGLSFLSNLWATNGCDIPTRRNVQNHYFNGFMITTLLLLLLQNIVTPKRVIVMVLNFERMLFMPISESC